MKPFTTFAIAAILVWIPFLLHAQDSTQAPQPDTVLVQEVTSGTTFKTADGTTFTLLGLAIPTSKAVSANEAKEHLATMIEGKSVVLLTDTLAPADTRKSKLRFVYLGSTFVNLRMIEEGYATTTKANHSFSASFAEALTTARSSNRGAHATERSTAVQCSGTTQKGARCKRTTTNLNGRCWQHQ